MEVSIGIENVVVRTIYDKRNDFNFDTFKMLHLSSNVDLSVFRNFYINGLNRIKKISFNFADITWDVANLYGMAITQGYPVRLLNDMTNDFIKKKGY